jgi:ATP-dependent protease ClpP protease subunit
MREVKTMNNRFYTMGATGNAADIYIFGDITSVPFAESDVDAHSFASDLVSLEAVSEITCHISSYGGEVEEGLAIYNALLSNPAHVTTICEGQACSIASVIFMAGDTRIMRSASALFVHDCWTIAQGDADDLRKVADDLDEQMIACKLAYMRGGIDEADLDSLLKADTWVSPDDAVSYGFATEVDLGEESDKVAASAHNAAYARIFAKPSAPTDALPAYAQDLASMIADEVCARTTAADQPTQIDPEPVHMSPAKRLSAALNR